MNDLQQAAEQVKNAGRMFRSVVLLADAVERIGSLDAASQESESRLALRRKELFDAEAELKLALAAVEEHKGLALRIVSEAEDAAKRVRAAAASDAAAAHAEAKRVLADAQLGRKTVESQFVKEREDLGSLIKMIDARKLELADVESKIAAVKANALKALGA